MIDAAGEPAVVYVAVVLAAALIVVEIALPTFGLAGATAIGLIAVAVWAVDDGEVEWWPLAITTVAVGLWSVMIARRSAPPVQQVIAGAAFAVGSFLFAGLEGDVLTVVLALIASVGLPLGFPALFERAKRLADQPSVVGMESNTGQTATVLAWAGGKGTVLREGSNWNATGPADLRVGDDVVITGFEGMSFTVRPTAVPTQEGLPLIVPQAEDR